MTETVLKTLLKQQHLQEHSAFAREYDRVAASVDKALKGAPSIATFYRWLAGNGGKLPQPRSCRVLELLFPGWSVAELLAPWEEGVPHQPQLRPDESTERPVMELPQLLARTSQYADLAAVFTSRAEFTHEVPPTALFDHATEISACGLSLNSICQHYGDRALKELLEDGCTVSLLFLQPYGDEIAVREFQESYSAGDLSSLTEMNIRLMERLRSSLSPEAQSRVAIRTYDEPVRFNITLVNNKTCIFQPYLPQARGLDSPAFVANKGSLVSTHGLYDIFGEVFSSLWDRAASR